MQYKFAAVAALFLVLLTVAASQISWNGDDNMVTTSTEITKTFGRKAYGDAYVAEQKTKTVSKFTLYDDRAEISKLTIYIAFATNVKMKAVIYSDSSGSPSALLAVGTEVTVNTVNEALFDLPFAARVTLDAGDYWIGFICDATFPNIVYEIVTNGRADTVDAYADGPSATFGAITWENGSICIFATYYVDKVLSSVITGHQVTTVTSSRAIRWQEKSGYAAGRIWVFYVEGTKGYYTSSADDGVTWATPVDLGRTIIESGLGENLQALFNGTRVHVFTREHPAATEIHYRSGIVNTDGTITWTAADATAWSCGSPNVDFFAALDSNGYPWISWGMGTLDDTVTYVTKSSTNNGTWNTAGGYPVQVSESEADAYLNNNFIMALSGGKMYVFYFATNAIIKGKLWNGVSWGSQESVTTSKIIEQYGAPGHETWSRGCVVDDDDNIHLAFLDNGGDNTGNPYFLDPFSYNIRYVKRTWPSGWGTEQLVEADLTNKNASPAVSLNEGFVRIFWVSQPQDWITYRRLDNDGWISRPVYLVDEQTDTFETAGNYGYDGITNPFVQLFSGKFGLLWLTKGGSYKLKFALQSFTGEYETRDTTVFDSIKAHYEKVSASTSFAVTRSALTLGDRDSTTGQYALEYTDETIEMMLVDKSNQRFAMELGYIVHLDAVGYTTDVVRVYDRIVDSVGRRWLVQTVTPIFNGSVFQFYVCELKEMSLYVE